MNINGSILKSARLQKGWTQETLAEVASLSTRTVQRAERKGIASLETIAAFCSVLDTGREDLCSVTPMTMKDTQNIAFQIWVYTALSFVFGGFLGAVVVNFTK